MSTVSFSIVIPVYNAEKFLAEAVDSVLNQGYGNWELLLINDGSSDDSREICQKYAEMHEFIRLLEHEGGINKGVSASRNLGLREAKNDWISFLDADDYWDPEKLQAEAEIISKHDDLVLIYSDALIFHHPNAEMNGKSYGSGKKSYLKDPFLATLKGEQIHLSNVSVHAAVIRREKLQFNEKLRFSEDTLFCHEVLQFGALYYHPRTLSHYRFSSTSATAIIPQPEQVLGRLVVYEHLLKNAMPENRAAISYELVDTGLERVWKFALRFPFAYGKILFSSLRKIFKNRKVSGTDKVRAVFGPALILFKFILKKIKA